MERNGLPLPVGGNFSSQSWAKTHVFEEIKKPVTQGIKAYQIISSLECKEENLFVLQLK